MTKPLAWTLVTILLVVPWVATLWTATYNTHSPTFVGFPFFYWYQLLWIPLSVLTTGAAYLIVRRLERDRRRARDDADRPGE